MEESQYVQRCGGRKGQKGVRESSEFPLGPESQVVPGECEPRAVPGSGIRLCSVGEKQVVGAWESNLKILFWQLNRRY